MPVLRQSGVDFNLLKNSCHGHWTMNLAEKCFSSGQAGGALALTEGRSCQSASLDWRPASNAGHHLGQVGQVGHGQHGPGMRPCSLQSPTLQTNVISNACNLSMGLTWHVSWCNALTARTVSVTSTWLSVFVQGPAC